MATFEFDVKISKGCHCNGCGEYIDAHGSVDLDDESVEKLLELIRENDGETDIEELELEEKLPEVYSALEDAYREAVSDTCFWDWAKEGYENGYFDQPDDLRSQMEEAGDFQFDMAAYREENGYDEDEEIDEDELEDAKDEAFDEWIGGYYDSLDEEGKHGFLETYYFDALNYSCIDGYDYDMEIPEGIIAML